MDTHVLIEKRWLKKTNNIIQFSVAATYPHMDINDAHLQWIPLYVVVRASASLSLPYCSCYQIIHHVEWNLETDTRSKWMRVRCRRLMTRRVMILLIRVIRVQFWMSEKSLRADPEKHTENDMFFMLWASLSHLWEVSDWCVRQRSLKIIMEILHEGISFRKNSLHSFF